MNKLAMAVIVILLICIISFIVIKQICHTIETNIAYTNPVIKYVRKSTQKSIITLHSDTKLNIEKSDKLILLPDGSYEFLNPVNISFTSTTTVSSTVSTTVDETLNSKPDLSAIKGGEWLLSIEYIHVNHDTDIQKLFLYRELFCNFYAGIGVYVRMDLFSEDYLPKWEWQNIALGVLYRF